MNYLLVDKTRSRSTSLFSDVKSITRETNERLLIFVTEELKRSQGSHVHHDREVFTDLLNEKKGKISVFYCGPPALSTTLTTKCRQYGFVYKKELF
ncbi:unnamed protein product [Adineta ricciae]|uniref:Uncharacterized protein n=1 Tax=Adineta ricciae TaxID=249248 RepID=A0A815D8S1_ADIRI|nr:unnamed protein product [Adineta ricciae]